MKIEEITIQGFRGFREKITIDLHPNVTVLVGVNGSGKTSVLDAIGKLLEIIERIVLCTLYEIDTLENNDINYFEEYCTIGINIVDNESWMLIKEKNKEVRLEPTSNVNNLVRYVRNYFNQHVKFYLPTLAYYSINRNSNGDIANNIEPPEFKELPYFIDHFDKSFNAFCEFEDWFVIVVNSIRIAEERGWGKSYKTRELRIVKQAFRLLNKEFFGSIYKGFFYLKTFKGRGRGSNLFIKRKKQEVRLDSLSDGESNIILTVCDIARRLAENDCALKGKGIILIDEIELHLHPNWQRKFVPILTKIFPNIQFILTTNSPQVLSNLKEENIRVIEDFKLVKEINPVYGEDSNDILWNIFGVKKRPLHAEEKFSNFYKLLETDQEKAKEALNELEMIYGSEHTEVKQAQTDYEFEFGEDD